MYKNILVPIALDHERDVGAALDVAHKLLIAGGKITAIHIIEMIPGYVAVHMPGGFEEKRQSEAMASLKEKLGESGDVKADVILGHAGRSIQDYAEQHDNDCIIVASHRPGLQDYFLGSPAAWVVRHANCSVHVVR